MKIPQKVLGATFLKHPVHVMSDVESRRRLRHGSTTTLLVPSMRLATLRDRAFAVAAAPA